jgi:hypothetical protein
VYLRRCYRQKDGNRHAYWALVESYRTARGPRQRVVAYLGELDEQGRLGVLRAAERDSAPQADLFDRQASPEWVEVDLGGVRVERSRPFGGGWLGLMLGVCKISSWSQIKTMPRQALEALSDTSRDSRFAIVPDSSISIESPEDCEWLASLSSPSLV